MAYIAEYSELSPKERRQLTYKRKYKDEHPDWDDTMVKLVSLFRSDARELKGLDLGCGRGSFFFDELREQFSEVIGIDFSEEQTRGNVTCNSIVFADLASLPFTGESFDVVTSQWVLEHVADPVRVFAEVHRVLKPGGRFGFVTPNADAFIVQVRRYMPDKLATMIVDRLYGRKEEDAFSVHYLANTLSNLQGFAVAAGLSIEYLAVNADPSYTSVNDVTYRLSERVARLPIFQPHIVGALRKKKG